MRSRESMVVEGAVSGGDADTGGGKKNKAGTDVPLLDASGASQRLLPTSTARNTSKPSSKEMSSHLGHAYGPYWYFSGSLT